MLGVVSEVTIVDVISFEFSHLDDFSTECQVKFINAIIIY